MADVPAVPAPLRSGAAVLPRVDRPTAIAEPRARPETPGMRVLRPPRALWQRLPSRDPWRPPAIVPVASPVPRASAPVPSQSGVAAPLPGPLLIVACAESRVVEQLRQHLPIASVLQNLGGIMPRTGRAARVQADAATVDAAIEASGIRHVVCVGHLGCRIADGAGRVTRPTSPDADGRRHQQRAIEHHVFTQLQRVRAYLRQREAAPTIRLSGLWVDEGSGHVHAFDPAQRRFAPLESFDLLRYSMLVPGRAGESDGSSGDRGD